MRNRNLGKSQSHPASDAVRRHDIWRKPQTRVVLFTQPNVRRGVGRRGAR
jgi:hypothetical protein